MRAIQEATAKMICDKAVLVAWIIVFLIIFLKLLGLVNVSWCWVLLPLAAPMLLAAAFLFFYVVFSIIDK